METATTILDLSRKRSQILHRKDRLLLQLKELEGELAQVDDEICQEVKRVKEAHGIVP